MLKPASKLVNDFDECWRMGTVNAIIQKAKCSKCSKIVSADVPFLVGTSLGPVACAFIMELCSANDDKEIVRLFHSLHGFQIAPNTVTQARCAASISMEGQIQFLAKKNQLTAVGADR